MNEYKMLVTDIDGTILGKSGEISKDVITAIKKATQKGIKVVVATGRMYEATTYITDTLSLDTPVICCQGALIRDKKEILKISSIEKKSALELLNILKTYKEHINVYTKDTLYSEKVTEELLAYVSERHLDYKLIDDFKNLNDEIIKIITISKTPEKNDIIRQEMAKKFGNNLNIVKSTNIFCEFVNKNSDKSFAIKFLSELWNINKKDIIAVGDQENDISMIKSSGFGVAMGNGCENIKAVADYICPSVDDNGVAHLINKYIL